MEKETKRRLKVVSIVLVAMVAVIITIVLLTGNNDDGDFKDEELNMPYDYTYGKAMANNGMELHYIRTKPSNITLEPIFNNVTVAPFYGINGGFFYQNALLSIAVVNDEPVSKEKGSYGTGAVNAKYARGTLVWDESLDVLSVQVVSKPSDLAVTDRSRYWAQGGISMSLDRDADWLEQAMAEQVPLPNDYCLRSAAVYDTEGNLYLVVSTIKGTLASFREAVVEQIGDGKLVNGIFLDGDGSSQLRSREAKLQGDGRMVVQMLRLLR
ncbi:hypothetical protein [Cohnella abietis]|uniref:Phosphodiester glycosidase domain-containing protein n=1 Tax=Cohnella abietis TaxID=2507935 RepID=A0A3T1DCG7_9BACL|nr:hypothetical protein [Cohnella abietis]BBI35810.1 hypothetical protein KCTCHS21_52090 [Cohnella abietis]